MRRQNTPPEARKQGDPTWVAYAAVRGAAQLGSLARSCTPLPKGDPSGPTWVTCVAVRGVTQLGSLARSYTPLSKAGPDWVAPTGKPPTTHGLLNTEQTQNPRRETGGSAFGRSKMT